MSKRRPERYRAEWQDLRDVSAFLDPGHDVIEVEGYPLARRAFRHAAKITRDLADEGWIDGGLTLRLVDLRDGWFVVRAAGRSASPRVALEVSSRLLEASDSDFA